MQLLVKSREMTGRSKRCRGGWGEEDKDDRKQNTFPHWLNVSFDLSKSSSVRCRWPNKENNNEHLYRKKDNCQLISQLMKLLLLICIRSFHSSLLSYADLNILELE
jgi:hypothetical protein